MEGIFNHLINDLVVFIHEMKNILIERRDL